MHKIKIGYASDASTHRERDTPVLGHTSKPPASPVLQNPAHPAFLRLFVCALRCVALRCVALRCVAFSRPRLRTTRIETCLLTCLGSMPGVGPVAGMDRDRESCRGGYLAAERGRERETSPSPSACQGLLVGLSHTRCLPGGTWHGSPRTIPQRLVRRPNFVHAGMPAQLRNRAATVCLVTRSGRSDMFGSQTRRGVASRHVGGASTIDDRERVPAIPADARTDEMSPHEVGGTVSLALFLSSLSSAISRLGLRAALTCIVVLFTGIRRLARGGRL
ncbi:hypothetical protein GGS23DRAFT_229295 [Durotheca rogersii]|uniref:uncharacterized protein n=1 Tax=Durotheca rogersii TaxID=419775 RepID=UPI00221E5C4D|nr:uncharacterized protein GGS23DRAFT_229295 [Durotheca rogersii]KAI5860571.1 hypothetical protein GGS23DRAFT_229295 [Durotheca rogersii]